MKRYITLGLFLISCICLVAQTTKTYTIPFNREDFTITNTSTGNSINSSQHCLRYNYNESSRPAIPFITINILLPEGMQIKEYSYKIEESTNIDTCIVLENGLDLVTTDLHSTADTIQELLYPLEYYPCELKFMGENSLGIYRYVSFEVSPLSYDATKRIITWINSVDITLNLANESYKENKVYSEMHKKHILSMVNNPEDIYAQSQSARTMLATAESDTTYSYLIITSNNLKNEFQSLANWKTIKGVKAKIMTVEDIYSKYSNQTQQLKIKQCIKDHYDKGLKYVLLGGDETIVPVQGCYDSIRANTVFGPQDIIYNDIPTDLFYASLESSGSFDWNADGDSLIGESNDNVCFESSIAIGRAPVSTSNQAKTFVEKTINYEFNPLLTYHYRKFLLAGTEKYGTYYGRSDAEAESELMFERYVKQNWANVAKYRFFDTASDFEGRDTLYNYGNMMKHLSNGYHHLHVNSHGYDTNWSMEVGGNFYNSHASLIKNNTPTIIATTACLTNSFDKPDSCLGESFIRCPSNGVVAYLGASREGLGGGWSTLGISSTYNGLFYQNMFRNQGTLGEAVAYAKNTNVANCKKYVEDRFIQYGLNLLGDPELNIYTDSVQILEEGEDFRLWISENLLRVMTMDSYGLTVSLTSKSDNGNFYSKVLKGHNNSSAGTLYYDFEIPQSLSIKDLQLCLIKQNHIPVLIKEFNDTYVQNITYTGNQTITGKNIYIGKDVTRTKAEGPVVIQSGNTIFDAVNSVTIKNGFECKKGAILEIK